MNSAYLDEKYITHTRDKPITLKLKVKLSVGITSVRNQLLLETLFYLSEELKVRIGEFVQHYNL